MQLSFNCHSNTVIQLSCHSTVIQLISKLNSSVTPNRFKLNCDTKTIPMSQVTPNPFNVNCHSRSIQCQLPLQFDSISPVTQNIFNVQIDSISLVTPNRIHFTQTHQKAMQLPFPQTIYAINYIH